MTIHAPSGRVFISLKAGEIVTAPSIASTTAVPVFNVTGVATYGDLGLTSVFATDGFLYYTYSTSATPSTCADTGSGAVTRPAASVLGCPTAGALARVALFSNGSIRVDTTEIILGGVVAKGGVCSQFTSLGIDGVTLGPDGALYVGVGTGANDLADGGTDIGQYGADPCGVVGAAFGGHFRAQTSSSFDGKILRVDVTTKVATVFSSGFHNPWRHVWASVPSSRTSAPPSQPALYTLDPGGANATTDEINGPLLLGANAGWPCLVGSSTKTIFSDLGAPACASSSMDAFLQPMYSTSHPGSPGTYSALAYFPPLNRWVYADYTQGGIYSFDAFEGSKTSASSSSLSKDGKFTFGVDLFYDASSEKLFVVDVVKGTVTVVAVGSGPKVNPSATSSALARTSIFTEGLALLVVIVIVAVF